VVFPATQEGGCVGLSLVRLQHGKNNNVPLSVFSRLGNEKITASDTASRSEFWFAMEEHTLVVESGGVHSQ